MMVSESAFADFAKTLILTRRSILPKRLIAPGPSKKELELIFSAAAAAPDHGLIRPWRFVICSEKSRESLASAFSECLLTRDPTATQDQVNDARSKAYRSPCLMLAVINTKGLDVEIPISERYISAGCAIQNLMLIAHSMGYGSSPTSGKSLHMEPIRNFFKLSQDENPICFIGIGTVAKHKAGVSRMLPNDFVSEI